MKRTVLYLSMIGVMLCLGASAAPLTLCSYVSPETDLHSLGLSMSYRYFDDWGTEGVDASGGQVGLDYSRLYDSPDFGYTVDGNVDVLLQDFFPTSGMADVVGTYRYYMVPEGLSFGFGGLEASLASGQLQPAVHVGVGIGYGRFSDVTPLAKALKIETELLKTGAIPMPLQDDVLMGIAAAIGSKEYASRHDQIADVVGQIQTASNVILTARQVLKVEDLILAAGDARRCGWAVRAGVGYQLVDPYAQPHGLLVTASADAAFAPNPDGQMLLHAGLTGPINILEQNTLRVRGSYNLILSETSSLRMTYSLLNVQLAGQPASLSQTVATLVGFSVGQADMGMQLSLSKAADASAWAMDISLSAAISFDY